MIRIFDTTLRDGEQSPGCSMNLNEKLLMARQLEHLGVDIIEAGFAISSQGDFEAVQGIARTVKKPIVASLARASQKDIDVAWEALKDAVHPRIHVFIATSALHMEYKLRMTEDEVYDRATKAVAYARTYTDDVEFSPEDATRSDRAFLYRILEGVIRAGATTVNIADTVGYMTPELFHDLIRGIRENVPNIDDAVISVHCHNDLGMATANSLSGVSAGARQIECTVNGIGERAGNTSLEEVVMALKTRADHYGEDCGTSINTREILKSSKLLAQITGVPVQPNKAIVGANAFAHESGIHQHGMLANAETYEIMTPESVGYSETNLVLGKHSGRHAFTQRLKDLGYEMETEEINELFVKFKALADKKKTVDDRDLDALVTDGLAGMEEEYTFLDYKVMKTSHNGTFNTVTVSRNGKTIEQVGRGDGPVDAAFDALGQITGIYVKLQDFSMRSVTEGQDALGDTVIKLESNGRFYTGKGLSTDVIASTILAYLNAINHMAYFEERQRSKAVTESYGSNEPYEATDQNTVQYAKQETI